MKTIKRYINIAIAVILVLSFSSTIGVNKVSAANNAFSITEWGINIGDKSYDEVNGALDNVLEFWPKSNVTYTAYTSDAKIVKASITKTKNGVKVVGVNPGKATVTLKQTVKGKTTVIGTSKITVVRATAQLNEEKYSNIGLGIQPSNIRVLSRRLDSKIVYVTDKKGLTITETFNEKTKLYDTEVNATELGKYRVVVQEVVGGTVRNMKAYNYTVNPMTVKKTFKLQSDESTPAFNMLNYYDRNYNYYFEGPNELDLYLPEVKGQHLLIPDFKNGPFCFAYTNIAAVKPGTMTVKAYKVNKEDSTNREYIGSITITVTTQTY